MSKSSIEMQWRQIISDILSVPSRPFVDLSLKLAPFMDSEIPLVTVVLVHHDRHNYLKQAIESLEAQKFTNFELIVVDDGSNDPDSIRYLSDLSWSWWQEKPWKVLREPNRYLGAARNTGGTLETDN